MAESYVHYQGKGFFAADDMVYRLVILLMEQYSLIATALDTNLSNHFNWLKSCIQRSGPGCVDLRLDQYVDAHNSTKFQQIVRLARDEVLKQGNELPGEYFDAKLHLEGIKYSRTATAKMVRMLENLENLFDKSSHPA